MLEIVNVAVIGHRLPNLTIVGCRSATFFPRGNRSASRWPGSFASAALRDGKLRAGRGQADVLSHQPTPSLMKSMHKPQEVDSMFASSSSFLAVDYDRPSTQVSSSGAVVRRMVADADDGSGCRRATGFTRRQSEYLMPSRAPDAAQSTSSRFSASTSGRAPRQPRCGDAAASRREGFFAMSRCIDGLPV